MTKLLVAVVALLLVVLGLPIAVALVVTVGTAAEACIDDAWPASSTFAPAHPASGTVRVAHANILTSMPAQRHHADLDAVVRQRPDVVSLNEVGRRSMAQLQRPGYQTFRSSGTGDGTAVMWRADRWQMADRGRVQLVADGPQRWDRDRGATWVTLEERGAAGSGVISVVSVHHMINPAKFGPDRPLRQQLYRAGMARLRQVVDRLASVGPVFVAGDFNSQYVADDPWGPRRMLATVALRPTFDDLGKQATHDGGGTIDYIFYQPSAGTALRQTVHDLHSDHHLLIADIELHDGRRGQGGPPSVATSNPAELQRQLSQVLLGVSGLSIDAEQAANAATIAAVSQRLGVPQEGLSVALATALQESGLRNLDHGDRDSQGLFQQRPSQGWGTASQVRHPALAAAAFFGRAQHTDNPGLLDVPGWQRMTLTQAAQAVQRSAYPSAYARWGPRATRLAALLTGNRVDATSAAATSPPSCQAPTAAVSGCGGEPESRFALGPVEPQLRALVAELAPRFGIESVGGHRESATDPLGHPAGLAADFMVPLMAAGQATGGALAAYAQQQAVRLGVDYIIWRQRIWSRARADEGWRAMADRGSDTANHLDHVHISVLPRRRSTAKGVEGGTKEVACAEVVYPVPDRYRSSDRRNWREVSALRSSWHTGTDFSVPCGVPVYAAHAGTIEIDTTQAWAGRALVKVSAGPGSLTTWYAHLRTTTVSRGQTVGPGEQLGTVGGDRPEDGNSTGCHLHFEVHLDGGPLYGGDNTDPSAWLARHTSPTLPRSVGIPRRTAGSADRRTGHAA